MIAQNGGGGEEGDGEIVAAREGRRGWCRDARGAALVGLGSDFPLKPELSCSLADSRNPRVDGSEKSVLGHLLASIIVGQPSPGTFGISTSTKISCLVGD